MKKHEWHDRTDDGDTRFVRATHHGGRWQLFTRLKSGGDWEQVKNPSREDLEELRDVLWRKYQRRRGAFKEVESVDRLVIAAGGESQFTKEEKD